MKQITPDSHPSHDDPSQEDSSQATPEALLYKKIKESEERFQAAVSAVEGILWTNNAHGQMEGEQPAWAALTGQQFDEYQGYGWSKAVHPDDAQPTVDAWEKAVASQSTFIFEHRVKVKEGGWKLFSIRAIPLKNEDGSIREWVGVHTDITEKRRAENILKESEERFRNMAESSDILIGVNDESIGAVYFNKAWEKLLGKPVKELLNLGWLELLHPDDKEPFMNKFLTAFNNKESYDGEFRMLNKDGEYSWIYAKVQVRLHPDGSYAGHISSCLDITERKKNENAVKQSESNLHSMVLAAPIGMCIIDAHTLVNEVTNDRFVQIVGKPYDSIIGHHHWDTFAEAEPYYGPALQGVIETGKPFFANEVELMLIRHGREEMMYVTFVYMPMKGADNRVNKIVVWTLDNTPQVNARKLVQQSESRFRNMFEQAPVAMLLSRGEDMVIESVNTTMLPFIHKKSPDEVLGKKLVDALPELDGQPIIKIVLDVLRTGIPFRGEEQPVDLFYNDKLERRYFNLSYDRIEDGSTTAAVLHMAVDVTEHVLARRKIEESEKQFRLLADTMPQLVWTANAQGRRQYNNQAMYDYSGLSAEQIEKVGWMQIVHPDDLDENRRVWRQSVETGKDFIFEHRFRRYDGEYRWQLSRAVPQRDAEGNIVMWVGSSTDIQKIKEEEKRKGDFIKVVSHELKTPITSMKGYVQILLKLLEKEKEQDLRGIPLQSSLQRIDKQIIRLTKLINEMLDLTRLEDSKMLLNKQNFDLPQLVQETVQDMMHSNTSHSMQVHVHAEGEIYADRDRIQQVLINFINNAIKYSPFNKEIHVSIDRADNNQIAVSVKDQGIGIMKADHEKIFERFYRVAGKNEETYAGFGIGLFVASQIIDLHGGSISVDSEIGEGAVFTFILPLV